MEVLNAYSEAIAISLVVIISYIFNAISKKTGIPSVLLLIILGFGAQQFLLTIEVDLSMLIQEALELLGVIGLIMIVLEAALDLKLEKEKQPLLIKSLVVALLSLVLTALAIAKTLNYFIIDDFYRAMMYAVPLSILSSAIIIPSVANLVPVKKEFMIYESTFSDILGIMFFYFLIGSADSETTSEVVGEVSLSILLTVVLSLLISYGMVLLLQNLQSKVKLFFLISVLVLLYAVGKMFQPLITADHYGLWPGAEQFRGIFQRKAQKITQERTSGTYSGRFSYRYHGICLCSAHLLFCDIRYDSRFLRPG